MTRSKSVHRGSKLFLRPARVCCVLGQEREYSIDVEISSAGILNHPKEVSLDRAFAVDSSM